jgi:hypothetical protein
MFSHVRAILRLIAVAMLVVTALLLPVARASAADNYTGTWSVLTVLQCTNPDFCSQLFGPNGATYLVNGLEITCADANNCTYRAYVVIEDNAPGAPKTCDPSVFGTPFAGTCRDTETGTVEVKPGISGMPDFFITDETANYYETGLQPLIGVHLPAGTANYPLDTSDPAVPGVYGTAPNLSWTGLLPTNGVVPPGVSIVTVIARSATPLALPVINQSSVGTSAAFVVSSFGAAPGTARVYFGTGSACTGLVGTGTQDAYPGFDLHAVLVSGNDLAGTVGDSGIAPGTTYFYEVETTGASGGVSLDSNGGKCYSVAIPK